MSTLHNITDKEFDSLVQSPVPIVIDFWAEWCGPCRMITPILEELAKELEGTVQVVKMNIDENPNTPSKLGIRSIPTIMLFKDGKVVSTSVGLKPKNSILQWINDNI